MNNQDSRKKVNGKKAGRPATNSFKHQAGALLSYLAALLILIAPAAAQENPPEKNAGGQQPQARSHFYDVDREVTVEGQIEDLKFETRYEGKGNFLVLLVKDKNSQELMEVETAPAWFFKTDIHKGEKIRLTGSLTEESKDGRKLVIAREMRIGNQTITLRDRRGFPTWSRGQGRRRGAAW